MRMMRDFSSVWDLDILDVGSLRDITRFAGAGFRLVLTSFVDLAGNRGDYRYGPRGWGRLARRDG